MEKIHVVTMPRLNRAALKVQSEMERHGFWDDALYAVDVYLVPLGVGFGWKWSGTSGNINIPRASWNKFIDWRQGEYTSLADVLRHEYGHAFADTHVKRIRTKAFRAAFGGAYGAKGKMEHDPEVHVSEYAAESIAEDFAETFMIFLKHDGRLPAKLDMPRIRKKWAFVERLSNRRL